MEHEALLDAILAAHAASLGASFDGYRNHARRVFRFCLALAGPRAADDAEAYAIAAAFHDLGLWTEDSLDYLPPSRTMARAWLTDNGRAALAPAVEDMIENHHALVGRPGDTRSPTEIFRRADLVDLSFGLRRFGLAAAQVAAVRRDLPNAGFHAFLARAFARRLTVHPLNLAPMMKWRPASFQSGPPARPAGR